MDLRLRFAEAHHRVETLQAQSLQAISLRLNKAHGRLDPLTGQLQQLSPLAVLERGYAIVQDAGGHIIKGPSEAPPGTALKLRLAGGTLDAEVKNS